MPGAASGGARPLNDYPFIHASNSAQRVSFRGAALPRAAPGGAMDVESGEHAVGGGRRIPRADFVQAAPIPQFEDHFPVPGAASGGARPLNDDRSLQRINTTGRHL